MAIDFPFLFSYLCVLNRRLCGQWQVLVRLGDVPSSGSANTKGPVLICRHQFVRQPHRLRHFLTPPNTKGPRTAAQGKVGLQSSPVSFTLTHEQMPNDSKRRSLTTAVKRANWPDHPRRELHSSLKLMTAATPLKWHLTLTEEPTTQPSTRRPPT